MLQGHGGWTVAAETSVVHSFALYWMVGYFLFLRFHGAGEARFHGLLLCHEVASDLIWVIDQSFDSCILTFGTHLPYNSTIPQYIRAMSQPQTGWVKG